MARTKVPVISNKPSSTMQTRSKNKNRPIEFSIPTTIEESNAGLFEEPTEEEIKRLPEFENLSNWFYDACSFTMTDARAVTLLLIQKHKITDLLSICLLYMRDRSFLVKLFPVGYLLKVEHALHLEFYKNLEELSETEMYMLLRNFGFPKDVCDVFFSNNLNGMVLHSLLNVENELVSVHVPVLFAKTLARKLIEWKTCGVPRKYLKPQQDNIQLVEELESLLLSRTVKDPLLDSAHSFDIPAEDIRRSPETTIQMALDIITDDFHFDPFADQEVKTPLNTDDSLDFEIFSSFADHFGENEEVPTLMDFCEVSPIHEGNQSFVDTPPDANLKGENIDNIFLVRSSRKGRKRKFGSVMEFTEETPDKEKKSPLPAFQPEQIVRNVSFLEMNVGALKESAINYFELLVKKYKTQVIPEVLKHRVISLVVAAAIKEPQEKLKKKCLVILLTSIRHASKEQLRGLLVLEDALPLVVSLLKMNSPTIINNTLILIEGLILKKVEFLESSIRIFLKVLAKNTEKVIKLKLSRQLARLIDLTLRAFPLEIPLLKEMIPILSELISVKELQTLNVVLSCCIIIAQEDSEKKRIQENRSTSKSSIVDNEGENFSSSEFTEYFVNNFPLEKILPLLGHRNTHIRSETMVLLCFIAEGSVEDTKVLLRKANPLPLIKDILNDKYEDRGVRAIALDCIGNICAGSEIEIQMVIDHEIFPVIFNFLNHELAHHLKLNKSHSSDMTDNQTECSNDISDGESDLIASLCLFAICNSLYTTTPEQEIYLMNFPLIEMFHLSLCAFPKNEKIIVELLHTILRLLHNLEHQEKLGELKSILRNNLYSQLQFYQTHSESLKIKEDAEKILAILDGKSPSITEQSKDV